MRRSLMNICRIVVPLALLGACSSGDSTAPPPASPPAPVVTTVEVTPGAPALNEGDSVQLAAAVKDQNGALMSGKTVSWSSSATGTATVSATGLVNALAAGSATITATVDAKTGSAIVTVAALPRIVTDPASAAHASIGALGGSVTATSGGTTYTLSVAPGSLRAATEITMTPVTSLRKLPAGGEYAAAVKLEPSGLHFLKPATLKVVAHVAPVSGKAFAAYLANDTGAVVTFAPVTQKGDTLTLAIPHFTVGGWGQFVPAQMPLVPLLQTSNPSDNASNQVLAANAAGAPMATYVPIFRQWYTAVVEPELVSASTQSELETAAGDFENWDASLSDTDKIRGFVGALVTALAPERQRGVSLLVRVLKSAISGRNASCAAAVTFSLSDPETIFLLEDTAHQFGVDTQANGLDIQTITSTICLKVVNTLADFPANPTPNVSAQLDLRYGVQFGTSPQAHSMLMKVTITLSGTTTDGTQVAQSDQQGALSGTMIPTGNQDFVAAMQACIHPSLGYRLDEICVSHSVTRPFGITVNDVSVFTQQGLQSLSNVAKVTGNLTISGATITSTDLSELASLKSVGGTIQVSGLPNLRSLQGLSKLNASPAALVLTGLPQLSNISALHAITSLPGSLRLEQLPLLADLTGLDNLTSVGVLSVAGLPLLTTIAPLGRAVIQRGVGIQGTGLITLTQLPKANSALPIGMFIADNPHLTDLAPLSTVVTTSSLQIANNSVLASLADLAGLQEVTDIADIRGPALASFGGLAALQRVGSLFLYLSELPNAGALGLPHLVTVTQDLVIEESFGNLFNACAAGPSSISMPELQSIGNLYVDGTEIGHPACVFDLSLPKLGAVTGAGQQHGIEIFRDGPRDIVLGNVGLTGTGDNFMLGLSGTIRKLATGTINVPTGSLLITGNSSLTTLTGGGGVIGGNLQMLQNAPISVALQAQWAAAFVVHGKREVN